MSPPHPPDDALRQFEDRLRPLLAAVRRVVADPLVSPGKEVVRRFLADAPVAACVRLFEVWQSAAAAGAPLPELLDRLAPEDRFVLDLVTTIYSIPDPADPPSAFPDYQHLAAMG
jgi:hypothetical protein